jgi:hypothetical protein
MLFCLSICDETHRVILDQDWYGPTLAMIEGKDWQEAREAAIRNPVMDDYTYVAGHGWYARTRVSQPVRNSSVEVSTKASPEH